ncbi:hypothetical protein [Thermogemmatispora sp.]|nr:hypothetical protein [Thermogemmatispora sp.]MBX5450899.1 hypothetical protein [Thermogemmatispora sp.]
MLVALIGLWVLVISLALYTIVLGGALLSLQRALRNLQMEFHVSAEES